MGAPTRKLGKNGPEVAALGFGLLPMSIAYGTIPSNEERFKVLDRAVEIGATFWDTAESVRVSNPDPLRLTILQYLRRQ